MDAEKAFQENSPQGLPGKDLFYEHVHLTFSGNYLLARTVFEQLVEVLPDSVRSLASGDSPPLSERKCAERLAFTEWDRYQAVNTIWGMVERAPFTDQSDHAERVRLLRGQLDELSARPGPEVLEQATALYRSAIGRAPDDWVLHSRYCDFLSAGGDLDRALEEAELVLHRVPHYPMHHNRVGAILLQQGCSTQAIAHFAEALRLNPGYAHAHYNWALALIQRGEDGEAESQFLEALRADPGHPQADSGLGRLLAHHGKTDEAIAHYLQSFSLGFENVEDHVSVARLLADKGRNEEAVAQYREALHLDPSRAEVHADLAALLAKMNKVQEAEGQCEEALRLQPGRPEMVALRTRLQGLPPPPR